MDLKLKPLLGNKLHGREWPAPSALYIRGPVIDRKATAVLSMDTASLFIAMNINFQDNDIDSVLISPSNVLFYI